MNNVQLIWAHPREDSLTARVAIAVREELSASGITVSELDLYRMEFDPSLQQVDEPDWNDIDKTYSEEVETLAAQLKAQDAVIFVFPVWWFSVPAILKGYIDRVWNHGIFYGGGRRLPFEKARWIALAGEPESSFTKRGLEKTMAHHLNVGIAGLCGAKDSHVEYLYDALGEEADDIAQHHATLIEQARQVARDLAQVKG
ncbi:NAD(P)H oxidoreductase [Brucella pseudogrignonensis]|uniref:NAD(P)H oxidoreductase n=1 Tax=Brucella pseudogrignonensis TaxID=419475 RepID=UPI003D98550C